MARAWLALLLWSVAASAQITIAPAVLPDSYRGSGYASVNTSGCSLTTSAVTLQASGGTRPYAFAIASGTLPPGLSLSADGRLAGETTVEGPTVQRTGDGRDGAIRSPSLLGDHPAAAIVRPLRGDRRPHLQLGFRCSASGESFSYSLPAGAVPPGVTVDPLAGTIRGVPTQPGQYAFDWRCAGTTVFVTATLTVQVDPMPETTLSTQVGAAFERTFDLGAGAAPFRYSIAQGAPPPGIQLAGSQALLSGAATQSGGFTFDVLRTAADERVATARFTINVQQAGGGGPAPDLSAAPGSLSFSASADGPSALQSALTLNSAGGASFQAATFTDSGGRWLSVQPPSGSVAAGRRATLTVQAEAGALAPGAYVGRIELTAPGGGAAVTIPVTLTKSRLDKRLVLTQTGLTVTVEQGSPPLTRGVFQAATAGAGVINFTTTASTTSGGNWLRPARTSGDTESSSVSAPESAVIDPTGLARAPTTASRRDRSGRGEFPQRATVVLEVRPRGRPVTPLLTPQGWCRSASAGANSTIFRFFTITTPRPRR